MAQTAATRRNAHAARRRTPSKRRGQAARPVKKAKATAKDAAPSTFGVGKLSRKAGAKVVKKLVAKLADAGGESIKSVAGRVVSSAGRAVSSGTSSLESGNGLIELGKRRRLPIQCSIDVAVPIRFAWDEWMALDFLPEGFHQVGDIEREGDQLVGKVLGVRPRDWAAEILDEREQQGLAWQSAEGSDCAGLVTFHELSRRLTRLELTLDVVPTSPAEAIGLVTHLADHRAEATLRRFKARLELINPDLYETDEDEQPEDEGPTGEDEDDRG